MKRWVGRAAAAVGIGALGLTIGCGNFFVYPGSTGSGGSGSGGSGSGDYVYVVNATTETLTGYVVGTGSLTAVTGSPYSLGFQPTSVAVNAADTRVFVAGSNGTNGFINVYSIASGGVLSLLVSNNVGSAGELAIDVSPDGNWLVGLDSNGPLAEEAVIDEYQINASGQLTLETGAIYQYSGSPAPSIVPRAIKFAPNGGYLFAAVGTAGDLVYTFNTSNGALTSPLSLSLGSASTSDNALAVNAASTYLYIARSGTNGGLAVYTIGSGGALNEVTGSPLAAGSQPFSVVVNTAGTDVYVADQVGAAIYGYSIATSGAVAALSPASYATVSTPRGLAVDNSGDYLLAISNAGSPDLAMYSYDATTVGKLDFSTSSATGTDPAGPVAMAATH